MQTFMPCSTFAASARVLDRNRLNAQRRETMTIMRSLHIPGRGYANHAVTRLWRGHECALLGYEAAITFEWHDVRGYKDTCWEKTYDVHTAWAHDDGSVCELNDAPWPPWLRRRSTQLAYRALLIRKAPDHYRPLWPRADDTIELVYPS